MHWREIAQGSSNRRSHLDNSGVEDHSLRYEDITNCGCTWGDTGTAHFKEGIPQRGEFCSGDEVRLSRADSGGAARWTRDCAIVRSRPSNHSLRGARPLKELPRQKEWAGGWALRPLLESNKP